MADRLRHVTATPITLPSAMAMGFGLLVSVAAFGYPFLAPLLPQVDSRPPGVTAAVPILLAIILLVALGVGWTILADVTGRAGRASKLVAVLATVVAVDAVLRLVPSFSGASAIFPLLIVAGAVFGTRFGFLAGSLTLLLSAVLTGGVGPWLPYQMLAAGWVGAGAACLTRQLRPRKGLLWLAAYGAFSGLAYGVLMSAASWPLAAPGGATDASLFWEPEAAPLTLIQRYAGYYLATSLGHDLARATANAILLLVLGQPLVRLLLRARRTLAWTPVTPPAQEIPGERSEPGRNGFAVSR